MSKLVRPLASWNERSVCLMGAVELRGSRNVLREAAGEVPAAYSPIESRFSSWDYSHLLNQDLITKSENGFIRLNAFRE